MTKKTSKASITHEQLVKKALRRKGVKKAYDELHDEFALLAKIIRLRKESGATQEEIADKMGTSTSAIGRLETNRGKHYHSPTLTTLRKYARALNYDVQLNFIPHRKISRTTV